MTRDAVREAIFWTHIIWAVGILNPLMIIPQFWKVVRTKDTSGISLGFLGILMALQAAFALHGFFIRDDLVMISNTLAALSTLMTALVVVYFRR